MRTTLDIDDDVLQAAKEIAQNRATTAGHVLSELARKALEPKGTARVRCQVSAAHTRTDLDFAVDAFKRVGRAIGILH